MKILDSGTESMSNAEVLRWMKKKRDQYGREDADEKAKGYKPAPRPKNFMTALERHERELNDRTKYPYARNPSAYLDVKDDSESLQQFDDRMSEKVIEPLAEPYREKARNGEMKIEELHKVLGRQQDKKGLTEVELLMIHNHAPTCVEMLQPMIEGVDERFTAEEQQLIVDAVMEVYRMDEGAKRG